MGATRPRPAFSRLEALVVLAVIATLLGLLIPWVQKTREAAARARCNISQVTLALIVHADAEGGRLPPAAECAEDGTALRGWRVPILPFIEGQDLYREFRPDEPWDGPHNASLLGRMPKLYGPPWREGSFPPGHAVLNVFVGPRSAFEGTVGLRHPADFPDGTSNTLLFVEAGGPSPWPKPDGIPFDPAGPLPTPRGLFRDGFRAGVADGSRRFVSRRVSEDVLRGMVTRNGGEELPREW